MSEHFPGFPLLVEIYDQVKQRVADRYDARPAGLRPVVPFGLSASIGKTRVRINPFSFKKIWFFSSSSPPH